MKTDNIKRHAVISEDGVYRYSLSRFWGAEGEPLKVMLFVMHNPSTADAVQDDPTIKKCMTFAVLHDCNAIAVVNLYAYRATDPLLLLEAARRGVDVQGPDNERCIEQSIAMAHCIVFAWGAVAGPEKAVHEQHAYETARRRGFMPVCLGTTKTGAPRHPLYVSYKVALEAWFPRGSE